MKKSDWKKALKPFADEFIKIQGIYYKKTYGIEKKMTKHFSDGCEYEIFVTECGWLIGRMDKKGNKKALAHDADFYK